ncbi:MAG: hypothetical protein K1Y36_00295 [Blastocatellia bacterium]|nr:hypothetical protein [Blastocatellia bacterium]
MRSCAMCQLPFARFVMWKQVLLGCGICWWLGFASVAGQEVKAGKEPPNPLAHLTLCAAASDRTVCVINTDEGGQWFLAGDGYLTTSLLSGEGFPTSNVDELRASPDGKYLAVVHYGEGHNWLVVVDFQALVNERKWIEQGEVMPYPGNLSLVGWKGSALYVSTTVLLSAMVETDGRRQVPYQLQLHKEETFAFEVPTKTISAVNPKLRDPGRYYGEALVNPGISLADKRDTILPALEYLKTPSSLPFVQKAIRLKGLVSIRKELQALSNVLTPAD